MVHTRLPENGIHCFCRFLFTVITVLPFRPFCCARKLKITIFPILSFLTPAQTDNFFKVSVKQQGPTAAVLSITYIIRPTGYRIFLNVSMHFFFTVTSRYFMGRTMCMLDSHGKVRSSSSWSCSLTSLLETDRDTDVSNHSLWPVLPYSVE